MNLLKWVCIFSLSSIVLSGCSSKGSFAGESLPDRSYPRAKKHTHTTYSELSDPMSLLAKRVIYFQYDSNEVAAEYLPILRAHARYLSSHPDQNILLTGHTDERGTAEYNITLAERYAFSVRRVLLLGETDDKQVHVLSLGEESPVSLRHDEAAWQQNRRVEISYAGH